MDFHLHFESGMLRMYATLLIQMLTNRDYSGSDENAALKQIEYDLGQLAINPELKCILYECLHAQDKTARREEERYHFEITR